MRKYLVILTVLLLAGCSTQQVHQKPVEDLSLRNQQWTLISGSGVTNDVVDASLSILDNAAAKNDMYAFTPIVYNAPLKRIALNYRLDVNYTKWYAEDTIEYRYNGVKHEYPLSYTKENSQRLKGLECEGQKSFDTILCYMPRLDAIYGPFTNVFAKGQQLVYTVTSYQNLNTQHILSMDDQSEFPYMNQLFLLYYNQSMDRVFVTEKTRQGAYKGLSYFENVQKATLFDEEYDMIFFDGSYIYIVQTDYLTELSTVYIYNADTSELVHKVESIDVGERAEFSYKDGMLLVYYVDVSFVEEKEFYYVMDRDLLRKKAVWKVEVQQN